jgi:K+-transporting ATPase KdpF subunit
VSGMENVILSVVASIVMLYLVIALIRPEKF